MASALKMISGRMIFNGISLKNDQWRMIFNGISLKNDQWKDDF